MAEYILEGIRENKKTSKKINLQLLNVTKLHQRLKHFAFFYNENFDKFKS